MVQAYRWESYSRQSSNISTSKKIKGLTDEQRRLAEENIGLAYKLGGRASMVPLGMTQEDWQADCFLMLVYAARGYQPDLGFAFSTYYYRSVKLHRRGVFKTLGLNREKAWDSHSDFSPFDALPSREPEPSDCLDQDAPRKLLARLKRAVPAAYRAGVHYWLRRHNGESAADIARSIGCSRQAVCKRCERALRAMRVYARQMGMVYA